jgi:transcriptional regulator with XRE-family HTH domain
MSYRVKLYVKELLNEKGITQKKLAELTGLRENTISDIVRNSRTAVNFEHLGKIATALDVDDIRKLINFEEV